MQLFIKQSNPQTIKWNELYYIVSMLKISGVRLWRLGLVALLLTVGCISAPILQPEQLRAYQFKEEISGNLEVLVPSTTDRENGQTFDQYTIVMEKTNQQILPPSFPKTPILAYGGLTKNGYVASFPSPSIIAKQKVATKVKWVNKVYGPHLLPVDFNHPFNSSSVFRNEIPLVPHAHGVATKVDSDGQPDAYWTALGSKGEMYKTVEPCKSNEAIYQYPNQQDPGLFWYHDHTCGITRLNVYAGLAGFYEIVSKTKSQQELALENYYGQMTRKELVISDKSFKTNGELYYSNSTTNVHFSSWVPEFFGNTIVVNGKVWPKLILNPGKYRFVMLNACQARYLNIFFLNKNKRLPFDLIRTEGDYLNSPVRVSQYLFTISARIEIVLDLTSVTGEVLMKNNADAPYPNGDPENLVDEFTGSIIKLQITSSGSQPKLTLLKDDNIQQQDQKETEMGQIELVGEKVIKQAVIKQSKYPAFAQGKHVFTTIVQVNDDLGTQSSGMFIDGVSFETSRDCANSRYKVGETYDIYMINLTPDSHPMHYHLINFQKIAQIPLKVEQYTAAWFEKNGGSPGRSGYSKAAVILDPTPYFDGEPIYPKESEKTFRDIVDMHPERVTVIRVKFAHNDGTPFGFQTKGSAYVFHCHMLEHEDNDMMKYFCLE